MVIGIEELTDQILFVVMVEVLGLALVWVEAALDLVVVA